MPPGDHRFTRCHKDRPSLRLIRPSSVWPPQPCRLVAGVAADEHPPLAVLTGDHDTQIPETDVIELGVDWKSPPVMRKVQELEVVRCGFARYVRHLAERRVSRAGDSADSST